MEDKPAAKGLGQLPNRPTTSIPINDKEKLVFTLPKEGWYLITYPDGTTETKLLPLPPNDDLREAIYSILSGKELYGETRFVVPEEMLDQILALLKADRQQQLDKLPNKLDPEKKHLFTTQNGTQVDYQDKRFCMGFNEALDQCRKIVKGLK